MSKVTKVSAPKISAAPIAAKSTPNHSIVVPEIREAACERRKLSEWIGELEEEGRGQLSYLRSFARALSMSRDSFFSANINHEVYLMRVATVFTILAIGAVPLAAQSKEDSTKAVVDGGKLPEGWSARPDGKGSIANVKFVTMGPGYHVTLGDATILYRKTDQVAGRFHTLATFTQTTTPKHPEGYGLFVGGQGLDGANQKYTYFLVRGDGTFLIKQREGDKTTNISQGWTAHPAIHKADSAGKATNKLEIDGKATADKLRFLVNGQAVYETDPANFDLQGIVGFRVNHNLDVHIDGFDIHRM